ncbi:hypothetical protein LCGC14_0017970 [marine sediment metagenome]|uniref:HEAT repeat domain-containing protein n=1 Tax=marine sediment metagenome TaxID=412755 RepID=A0A0F9YGG7_9ZZZZ|nr:hypothetical protein [Phycisphaerae bacterium]HDZ43849.1 hypothetical protein [Phycisphaerae bacterium]
MKRRRKIWLGLALAAVTLGGAISYTWWYSTTPEYELRRVIYQARIAIEDGAGLRGWLGRQGVLDKQEPKYHEGWAASEIGERFRGRPIGPLVDLLDDPNPEMRIFALKAMRFMGRDAHTALPAVVALIRAQRNILHTKRSGLSQQEVWVCEDQLDSAMRFFRTLGPTGVLDVPMLLEMLEDPSLSDDVRSEVAIVLGLARPVQEGVVAALVRACDKELKVAGSAIGALRKIGSADSQVTDKLVAMLGGRHEGLRPLAAVTLVELNPSAVEPHRQRVVALLTEAVESADVAWQGRLLSDVIVALMTLEPGSPVRDRVIDGDLAGTAFLWGLLGKIAAESEGRVADRIVSDLMEMLDSRDDMFVRPAAVSALADVGPAAAAAVPKLLVLLDADDVCLRRDAISALAETAHDTPGVQEAVFGAVDEMLVEFPESTGLAGYVYLKLGGREKGLRVFRQALNHPEHWSVRAEAIGWLDGLGPLAADLAPDLQAVADDENEWWDIREAAREAIKTIQAAQADAANTQPVGESGP